MRLDRIGKPAGQDRTGNQFTEFGFGHFFQSCYAFIKLAKNEQQPCNSIRNIHTGVPVRCPGAAVELSADTGDIEESLIHFVHG